MMVSDGFHYIEAEFKKEAINYFKKDYSHLTFNALRDRVIYIVQWSLKLVFRDGHQSFNSFNNLSIVLVIERFKPIMVETVQ